MPKMKSKTGAKKRFKANGAGKFRRGRKAKRHLLTRKAQKRKRQLRGTTMVDPTNHKQIHRMLPYA